MIMKETVGLVFVAGLMAAGVTGYLQDNRQAGSGEASPQVGSAPSAPGGALSLDRTMIGDRLRDAFSTEGSPPSSVPAATPVVASPAQPQSVTVPRPVEPVAVASVAAPMAVEDKPTTTAAVPQPARDAKPVLPPAETRWTSTPHPEIIAKADASFDNGDIAGARLWLEDALERGDADAAFRLAETYDPKVLAEWRVIGIASDVDKARALYAKARTGGVEAAIQREARLTR